MSLSIGWASKKSNASAYSYLCNLFEGFINLLREYSIQFDDDINPISIVMYFHHAQYTDENFHKCIIRVDRPPNH